MTKVRLKFSKYGPIRFVGHLDMMRYFQKVMRRAGADIAYSGGYSPHQLMSFAQPLSVGATSDGEYADLVLTETGEETLQDLVDRLRAVCNEGITVLDAQVLPEKAEKAMTAVAACAWRAAYRPEAWDGGTDGFEAFCAQECIPARKKTKKGLTELDIRPLIHRAQVGDDGSFDLLLKSGSEDNVKPALFLGAFLRYLGTDREELFLQGDELKPECLILHRSETYLAGEDERGRFLAPLICRDETQRIRLP